MSSAVEAGAGTGIVIGTWPSGMPPAGGWVVRLAQQVEALGYDYFMTGDHLFGHTPSEDALVLAAAVAAATERITVGTAVLLLALREPVVVAKQVATIDHLNPGRFILGIGIGGEVAAEWEAMQSPRESRGQRTDEYLELMSELWSGGEVNHEGTYRTVKGVVGSPVPATQGGPPVWIGGRSDAALRRAARHDGWCAYAMTPERFRQSRERLSEVAGERMPHIRLSHALFVHIDRSLQRSRRVAGAVLAERYGRSMDEHLDGLCALGPPERVAERVAEYREAGVHDILLSVQAPTDRLPDQYERAAGALHVASM